MRLNPTDKRKSKYKEILLNSLESLDDEEFKKFKFFLKSRFLLLKKNEQADRMDIAESLGEQLNKIIKIFKDMNLNEAAQDLERQKAQAEKQCSEKKDKKSATRNNQSQKRRPGSNDNNSTVTPQNNEVQMKMPAPDGNNNTGNPQLTQKDNLKSNSESKKNHVDKRKATTEEMPENKKRKASQENPQKTESEAGREDGPQTMPMIVKVLKVNKTFEYDTKEGEKKMFHATVANEHEFIRVKVLNMDVKEHFSKNKVIEISKGHWRGGFMEVNRYSRVQDVSTEITIPKNIIRRSTKTTKIQLLDKQKNSYVNGVYEIIKKTESEKCTFFEVKDNTGKIEVVAFGKWAKIKCDKGDKLQLTCFEYKCYKGTMQLKSVAHSFIQVIKAKKN
ncbi:interferon-inducible protein AIM2-like isoform X2 [Macrotis lagotis]|uniref:interferon-inducible protein AIM2-like isoform X2 n=1 Tax=Macrotis lagotis TaxID=92651 RepID=UPI003D69E569